MARGVEGPATVAPGGSAIPPNGGRVRDDSTIVGRGKTDDRKIAGRGVNGRTMVELGGVGGRRGPDQKLYERLGNQRHRQGTQGGVNGLHTDAWGGDRRPNAGHMRGRVVHPGG